MKDQTIIFFDGVCHLCNGFVDFLIRVDGKRKLKYAPLQGTTADELLSSRDRNALESVVLWENGITYYRSRALLKIFKKLGGPFRIFSFFFLFPPSWLDFFYQLIVSRRYKWFGQRDVCRLPTPKEKEYLLP